jgi:AraC-like DNA-binding protein
MAPNAEDLIGRRIPRDTLALCLLTNYLNIWQQGELTATPEMRQMLSDHVHDLLTLLLNAKGVDTEQAAERGGRAAQLALIRREIEHHFDNPDFSLPELARRVGVTPRYVQMLLEAVNSSFVKAMTEHRLRHACVLLQSAQHQHLSMIDIAHECGFGTVGHFHRLFRRWHGVTPSDWRNAQAAILKSQKKPGQS